MSPSRKGSWPGSSPARKAVASSGFSYPRRTRTRAVVSLTPSASASAPASPCGHGLIVQVPSCIARPRYGAGRTAQYPPSILGQVTVEANYSSGEDYMVEFLGYRFAFNAEDFEQRVTGAAVKLGLVDSNDLDEDETADLVELAADGRIEEARSPLGRYLVRHWEQLSLVKGESLVYWLRKLVFRGAWLDHRVKEGLLDVDWDEVEAEFGYRDPRGDRALLELAPVPSWHEVQFRR